MSEQLVLIGGDWPEAPLAWAKVVDGCLAAHGMVDASRPPPTPPQRTVLILPAADARLMRLKLPARAEAQACAGAKILVGATLASAEPMHYAVGAQQNQEGERLVAAISVSLMQRWLKCCAAFGADPGIVALDCTLWPANEGEVVIAATPSRVIVAGGVLGGFSIEPGLAPAVATQWLEGVGAARARVVVLGGDPTIYASALSREVAAAALPDPETTLALAGAEPPEFAPNLRQGAFAREGASPQSFTLWRFAALLLVAALMLQAGSLVLAGWRDAQAAQQIMARAEQDFRAARPDIGRVTNLRAQAASLVNAMEQSARHPVLVTSGPVVQALQQHPLARLDEVRHESPSRRVRLILSAPQPEFLEAAIAAIREQGVVLEARSVQPRGGRHVAELELEAP